MTTRRIALISGAIVATGVTLAGISTANAGSSFNFSFGAGHGSNGFAWGQAPTYQYGDTSKRKRVFGKYRRGRGGKSWTGNNGSSDGWRGNPGNTRQGLTGNYAGCYKEPVRETFTDANGRQMVRQRNQLVCQ